MRNTNINRLNKEKKEIDEIINSLMINNTKINKDRIENQIMLLKL